MGNFVNKNLAPGEDILYESKLHWMIYFGGFLWAVIGFIVYAVFSSFTSFAYYGLLIFLLIAIVQLGNSYIRQISTELVVTDQRFIAKFGFIARETIELPLFRIESVVVDQSILERILDSGSIAIHGTGSSMAPVRNIDSPVQFRNELNKAVELAKSAAQSAQQHQQIF